jgi:RNA polymerase sigma-B factor
MFLPNTLARRYHRGEEPLDDLRQVAVVGLLKALAGFDPVRGSSFTAYAVPTITGELRRHFRDKGWAVRVPRDLQELALRVMGADERLERRLGRRPTPNEVAQELGRGVEDVLEAREAAIALHSTSLDRPHHDSEGDGASIGDALGGLDGGYERAELGATLSRLACGLPARQREILVLRYAAGLTQQEIGERIGISQMHVSRQLRQALDRMSTLAQAA